MLIPINQKLFELIADFRMNDDDRDDAREGVEGSQGVCDLAAVGAKFRRLTKCPKTWEMSRDAVEHLSEEVYSEMDRETGAKWRATYKQLVSALEVR